MVSLKICRINVFIQDELNKRDMEEVTPVEAAKWLEEAGLLKDSKDRPGKPLRDLLRAKQIVGQNQLLNSRWFIKREE